MYIKRSGYNNAVMKIEKLAVHLLKANISLVKGQGGNYKGKYNQNA